MGFVGGVRNSPNMSPRVLLNSVLNGSGKLGSKTGNAAGVIALLYTGAWCDGCPRGYTGGSRCGMFVRVRGVMGAQGGIRVGVCVACLWSALLWVLL